MSYRFELKASENSVMLLACDGLKEAGFLQCFIEGGILRITHIEVNKEYRGLGIASDLVSRLIDFAAGKKLEIRPECSYALSYFRKHREALLYLEKGFDLSDNSKISMSCIIS